MARRRDWLLAKELKEVGLNWTDIGKIYRTSGGSVSRGVRNEFGEPDVNAVDLTEYPEALKVKIRKELEDNYEDEYQLKEMLWTIYCNNTKQLGSAEVYKLIFDDEGLLSKINNTVERLYWYYIKKGRVTYTKKMVLEGLTLKIEGLGNFKRLDYDTMEQVEFQIVIKDDLMEEERPNIFKLKEDIEDLSGVQDEFTVDWMEFQNIITIKVRGDENGDE